jgi:hypothetical protein
MGPEGTGGGRAYRLRAGAAEGARAAGGRARARGGARGGATVRGGGSRGAARSQARARMRLRWPSCMRAGVGMSAGWTPRGGACVGPGGGRLWVEICVGGGACATGGRGAPLEPSARRRGPRLRMPGPGTNGWHGGGGLYRLEAAGPGLGREAAGPRRWQGKLLRATQGRAWGAIDGEGARHGRPAAVRPRAARASLRAGRRRRCGARWRRAAVGWSGGCGGAGRGGAGRGGAGQGGARLGRARAQATA